MAATASWTWRSNRYTPTSARLDGGSCGFSTRRTISPPGPRAATPNCVGSSTGASRIWADGPLRSSSPRRGAAASARAASNALGELDEALLEHVVAQVHDEVVVAQEVAGDQHAVGQAERGLLRDVGDLDAPAGAVADVGHDVVGPGAADDDADLLDAGLGHRLDAVEDDRLVGDGHELLRARVGDGAEPAAGAPGEDETFHGSDIVAVRRRPGHNPAPGHARGRPRSRAMTRRWISLVPSPISRILASRYCRATRVSSMNP